LIPEGGRSSCAGGIRAAAAEVATATGDRAEDRVATLRSGVAVGGVSRDGRAARAAHNRPTHDAQRRRVDGLLLRFFALVERQHVGFFALAVFLKARLKVFRAAFNRGGCGSSNGATGSAARHTRQAFGGLQESRLPKQDVQSDEWSDLTDAKKISVFKSLNWDINQETGDDWSNPRDAIGYALKSNWAEIPEWRQNRIASALTPESDKSRFNRDILNIRDFENDPEDEGGIAYDDDGYMVDSKIEAPRKIINQQSNTTSVGWVVDHEKINDIYDDDMFSVVKDQGFIFRGLNNPEKQATFNADGSLTLLPGKNFDGQTNG